MAGGYGVKIEDTVRIQLNTYRVALDHWQRCKGVKASVGRTGKIRPHERNQT